MDAITWIEANDIQDGDDFGAVHRYSNDWYMPKFHVHPHYEFYLFLTGKVQIVIEDEIFDARPMDLFIFPPGTLHRANVLDAHTPYERAYFYVTRQAYVQDENQNDPIDRELQHLRMNSLALMICRIVQRRDPVSAKPPERISEVIRYINTHITEPLSLDDLSAQFFISKYTLLHEFKSYANISVYQYILSKRVLYAQLLMQRGISPGPASKQSGFNDYAGFYRAFMNQNNLSPQAYFEQFHNTQPAK